MMPSYDVNITITVEAENKAKAVMEAGERLEREGLDAANYVSVTAEGR